MRLYVKPTSNYPPGMPLTDFEELGPTWRGEQLIIPFGDERRRLPVVGWIDIALGRPCPVCVTKVRYTPAEVSGRKLGEPMVGYLIHGGDGGVRVFDGSAPVKDHDAHLPRGHGMPIAWVEDANDLPEEVRAVVAV